MDRTTLQTVRAAFAEETAAAIARQVGPDGWNGPLLDTLELLDVQTLALIIRDLEDTTNTGPNRVASEGQLWAVLTRARAAGEAKLGSTFDSVISEYE